MRLETFVLGMVETNTYVIIQEETKEALVIDPADTPSKFVDYFEKEGLELKGILLTHGHFDHIMGVNALQEKYGAPIYATDAEDVLLTDPRMNASIQVGKQIKVEKTNSVKDGEVLELAGFQIKVITTPGHTIGGCCYYFESEKKVFTGDTLFCRDIGRTDLPTGSYATLIQSIREKLLILPKEVVVYPGHMMTTMIGDESV